MVEVSLLYLNGHGKQSVGRTAWFHQEAIMSSRRVRCGKNKETHVPGSALKQGGFFGKDEAGSWLSWKPRSEVEESSCIT
jgi:hypothetical protein